MKKFSFLSLTILTMAFFCCISCSYLISTAVVSSFGYTTNISSQPQTVFAISLQSDENPKDLNENVTSLQSQNGAGFVFEQENKFYLIASVYENVNDAELVKNNLNSSGINSEIIEIPLENNSIKGNFDTNEKEILSASLKANYNTFKSLYDIAISLDTGVFDMSKAKLECNNVYSSLISIKTNLDTFFKNNTEIEFLKENLSTSTELLSKLISEQYENINQTFSSLIKLTYCKILFN